MDIQEYIISVISEIESEIKDIKNWIDGTTNTIIVDIEGDTEYGN